MNNKKIVSELMDYYFALSCYASEDISGLGSFVRSSRDCSNYTDLPFSYGSSNQVPDNSPEIMEEANENGKKAFKLYCPIYYSAVSFIVLDMESTLSWTSQGYQKMVKPSASLASCNSTEPISWTNDLFQHLQNCVIPGLNECMILPKDRLLIDDDLSKVALMILKRSIDNQDAWLIIASQLLSSIHQIPLDIPTALFDLAKKFKSPRHAALLIDYCWEKSMKMELIAHQVELLVASGKMEEGSKILAKYEAECNSVLLFPLKLKILITGG